LGEDSEGNVGAEIRYIQSSDYLALRAADAGDDAMVITSANGNVGIGTTDPAAKLEVSDSNINLRSLNSGGTNGINWQKAAVNGTNRSAYIDGIFTNDHRAHLAFGVNTSQTDTAATEIIRINNLGRVGIGTTSPSQIFNISKNVPNATTQNRTFVRLSNSTGSMQNGQQWGMDWAQTAIPLGAVNMEWQSPGTDMSFHTYTDATTTVSEKVRITNDGNVGIGTTNPLAQLEIAAGQSVLMLTDTNQGSTNEGVTFTLDQGELDISLYDSGGNDITIQGDADVILAGSSGGNVGIGTTALGNICKESRYTLTRLWE